MSAHVNGGCACVDTLYTGDDFIAKGCKCMEKPKFRCEVHAYEWFKGSAGCPSCLKAAIEAALNELGVPQPGYPAPVANAVATLKAAIS